MGRTDKAAELLQLPDTRYLRVRQYSKVNVNTIKYNYEKRTIVVSIE